ncbi:MAG TPA: efflux RND transporter periplasmic adaptor subunit, partial [Bacteroidota bacterium]
MKTLLYGITLLGLVASLQSCNSKHEDSASRADSTIASSSQEYYTCPMHPFVRSDRPGACPICGMALVKKTGAEKLSANQLDLLKDVSLSPTQKVLANVNTAAVQRRTLDRQINSVGVVSVAEPLQATIAARFSGRVEKLYADYTGTVVRKGEPLFELYSPELISAT